jgi:predicted acetyltransferase
MGSTQPGACDQYGPSGQGHFEMVRLQEASTTPPPGLNDLLADLGDGENGFGGTPVATGEATLAEFLQRCCDMADAAHCPSHLMPQTVYWALDDAGRAIGMVKLRHCLNDKLRLHGGHCGYYIHRNHRRKGYGTRVLRLALEELRRLGVDRALVTIDPENIPSIRVVEANGGQFADLATAPDTGGTVRRYWIDLSSGPATAT